MVTKSHEKPSADCHLSWESLSTTESSHDLRLAFDSCYFSWVLRFTNTAALELAKWGLDFVLPLFFILFFLVNTIVFYSVTGKFATCIC